MLSNLLPVSNILLNVVYSDFAITHFRKEFEKKYKGKRWEKTEASIFEDLKRLRVGNNKTQQTQQIDQLKYSDFKWLAKYDFRIAGTKESAKASGNRIVVFIDNNANTMTILLIYNKNDLPKNKSETSFIYDTIKEQFPLIAGTFSI